MASQGRKRLLSMGAVLLLDSPWRWPHLSQSSWGVWSAIKASPPRPPFVARFPLGEAESQLPFTVGWRGPVCIVPWVLVIYIIGDWNAKVGSQETSGVTGKFGLGIWNEAGQRLIVLPREPSSNNIREDSTHGHHQMVNTEIRLIIFFAAEDVKALYSQQKKTRSWLWHRSWTPYCQIQT